MYYLPEVLTSFGVHRIDLQATETATVFMWLYCEGRRHVVFFHYACSNMREAVPCCEGRGIVRLERGQNVITVTLESVILFYKPRYDSLYTGQIFY